MTDLQRRALLACGSLAALTPEAIAARAADVAPRGALDASQDAWHAAQSLPLWPQGPPGDGQFSGAPEPADAPWFYVRNVAVPELHVFLPPRPTGAGVLVIPGGGYEFVSVGNEGIDVAARLTALGQAVFVLTYRLPAEGWHDPAVVPLQDAQRALRVIRARAAQFGVEPDRLAVLGFSAGGHLAATLSTAYDRQVYTPVDDADQLSARPFATALIYPVITMTLPMTHAPSRRRLLGAAPSAAQVNAWSAEQQVGEGTPPCWLAHACDDDAVPVENSVWFFDAMRKAKRPVEAHLLQEGRHAFGVGRPGTPSAAWIDLYATWLRRL